MRRQIGGPKIGLRREVAFVLPVVLLLLVILSTYSLLTYRNGLNRLVDVRRSDTAERAGRLAAAIASGKLTAAVDIRDRATTSDRVAVLDNNGRVVLDLGSIPTGTALADFEGLELDRAVAIGPLSGEDHILAIAPTLYNGTRHFVHLDLRVAELARQLRNVRILLWFVLPINAALSIFVLLFLRRVTAPYDRLMATARRIQPQEEQDEVAYLISSFERAVQTIEKQPDPDSDLATLEMTLGPSLESGFLLLARDSSVLALNEIGTRLLGCEVPAQGSDLADVLRRHPKLHELISSAVQDEASVQRQEVEVESPDGEKTLGLTMHLLRRDDGATRGYLVLFADLTETRRKAEEERLSTSLAQVGELAAGVAHEMRNSLSTFRGYLTLVERAPDEGAITDYLDELRREAAHLERVLEDFLSFARPQSTRLERLNLETLVRRAAVDPALGEKAVDLDCSETLLIQGDAQLLERALRNLLENACQAQHTAEVDEPVRVSTSADSGFGRVDVADRGHGIPDEIRARLFEPFVTGRRDGVGLGLSLARRIIDLHGGLLEFSDRPGGGTVFSVSLPLLD